MGVVNLTPQGLARRLRGDAEGLPKAIKAGTRLAAQRGRTVVVHAMPVYTGQAKNAWKVVTGSDGWPRLINDAPHAGIIERGARPHNVSRDGVEALREWVRRTLKPEVRLNLKAQFGRGKSQRIQKGAVDDACEAIVWGIVKRLKEQGQKGLFIVEKRLDTLRDFVKDEVERKLQTHLDRGGA